MKDSLTPFARYMNRLAAAVDPSKADMIGATVFRQEMHMFNKNLGDVTAQSSLSPLQGFFEHSFKSAGLDRMTEDEFEKVDIRFGGSTAMGWTIESDSADPIYVRISGADAEGDRPAQRPFVLTAVNTLGDAFYDEKSRRRAEILPSYPGISLLRDTNYADDATIAVLIQQCITLNKAVGIYGIGRKESDFGIAVFKKSVEGLVPVRKKTEQEKMLRGGDPDILVVPILFDSEDLQVMADKTQQLSAIQDRCDQWGDECAYWPAAYALMNLPEREARPVVVHTLEKLKPAA